MSNQNEQKNKTGGVQIHAQLSAIMAQVEAVGKARRNETQKFNFRGIEDIMDSLHPIFSEHKVFILSEVLEDKTEERTTRQGGSLIYRILKVKISYVSGLDGSRESVVVIGEGMDSGDKAANKAMSAALKYALTQTLIIPYSGVVDGDSDSPPALTPKGQEGLRTSAHDGRVLKPGENPMPVQGTAVQNASAPTVTPTPTPPPTQIKAKPSEPGAFHSRLYDAMKQAGIEEQDLTAYLRKRGLMTANQTIHVLSQKLVDAMLDGIDATTRKNNFALIAENIKKARTA